MKLIDLIKLLWKNKVLLLLTPVALAILVAYLTRNPNYRYASDTTVFTGIATGSGVEMDKTFNYFMTNSAYDNLINIIKSNKTKKEVGIRLLSQHLMLKNPDSKYISKEAYNYFKKLVPNKIYSYVAKGNAKKSDNSKILNEIDTTAQLTTEIDSFSIYLAANADILLEVPSYINEEDYEQTVLNLTKLMESSDTNFVYELLHYPNPYYSIKAISEVQVRRISNSDLVQLKFETNDPGICQQTLIILTNVLARNYREIKENRSDEVVKYFEHQASLASNRLKLAEDKLLEFNKANKIINYYEQSKAVAVVKEDLDVAYHNMRIKLTGIEAAITRLEDKLGIQGRVQLKSDKIIEMKNKLGNLTYQIALAETVSPDDSIPENLNQLKSESLILQEEIKNDITDFYNYGNTPEGLPLDNLLTEWLDNVVEAENLRAGLEVFSNRIDEFQKQYSIYAPAGATVKRIEREISVAEREYLSILYGLNLAKLKLQDNELASIIKITDPPYFPLSPIPTKRKIMVVLAAMMGFIFVLATILALEYFDNNLRNPEKAAKMIGLNNIGTIPKIMIRAKKFNIHYIVNRLFEIIIQNIEQLADNNHANPKNLLIFSTSSNEGKTTITANLAKKLKQQGKKVFVLEYSRESIYQNWMEQNGQNDTPPPGSEPVEIRKKRSALQLGRLLGYPDARIDYSSTFLETSENCISTNEFSYFNTDEKYFNSENIDDLLKANHIQLNPKPDYIIIEIPPILYYPLPSGLISSINISLLVCRANRSWSDADKIAINSFMKYTTHKPFFILNGVELCEIESVLGDLPRKRSWFRQKMKNIVQFQLSSKTHI
jgi:uncharacterized protein involved in exopolysaccharide biosynthesis